MLDLPLAELNQGQTPNDLRHTAAFCGKAGEPKLRSSAIPDSQCLYQAAGHQGTAPVAALTGLADGLDTDEGFWLRADPVHLQVDMGPVYLSRMPGSAPEHSLEQVATVLRQPLAEMGWSLHTPNSERWYLQSGSAIPAWLPPPNQSLGIHLAELLPRTDEYQAVRQLQNEIQMLMHQVDRGGEGQGANSLWLWGGGALPEPRPDADWVEYESGDSSSFLQGLSELDNAARLRADDDRRTDTAACLWHWQHDPGQNRIDNARQLDQQLGQVLRRLQQGVFKTVCLDDGARKYTLNRSDRWKFWRRPRLPGS